MGHKWFCLRPTSLMLLLSAFCLGPMAFAQLAKPKPEDLALQQRRLPFSMPGSEPNNDPHDLTGRWKTDIGMPRGPLPLGGAPAGMGAGVALPPPGVTPGEAPLRPQNSAASDAAQRRRLQCLPDFGPWSSTEGAPTQIVQTKDMIMLLFEEFHKVRKIHLNDEHPQNLQPSYAGDSVGHWEGDTLIVDTAGIKGPPTIGQPDASPTLHLRERIRKTEGNTTLEVLMSYYDTAGGATPADQKVTAKWVGGPKIMEWVCEDFGQQDLEQPK